MGTEAQTGPKLPGSAPFSERTEESAVGFSVRSPALTHAPALLTNWDVRQSELGGLFSPGPRAAWCLPRLRSHLVVTHAGEDSETIHHIQFLLLVLLATHCIWS